MRILFGLVLELNWSRLLKLLTAFNTAKIDRGQLKIDRGNRLGGCAGRKNHYYRIIIIESLLQNYYYRITITESLFTVKVKAKAESLFTESLFT